MHIFKIAHPQTFAQNV